MKISPEMPVRSAPHVPEIVTGGGRNKRVRKSLPNVERRHTTAGVDRVAPDGRCSCCGSLRSVPQSCDVPKVLAEIHLPTPEGRVSLSCATADSFECAEEAITSLNLQCGNPSGIFKVPLISDKVLQDTCGGGYNEEEINGFVCVIEKKLEKIFGRLDRTMFRENPETVHQCPSKDEESPETSNMSSSGSLGDNCTCCGPIVLQHEKWYKRYPHVDASNEAIVAEDSKLHFRVGGVGKCEEVIKWGDLDVADRLVTEWRLGHEKDFGSCDMMDKFNQLDRLLCCDRKGLATICRQLFRW